MVPRVSDVSSVLFACLLIFAVGCQGDDSDPMGGREPDGGGVVDDGGGGVVHRDASGPGLDASVDEDAWVADMGDGGMDTGAPDGGPAHDGGVQDQGLPTDGGGRDAEVGDTGGVEPPDGSAPRDSGPEDSGGGDLAVDDSGAADGGAGDLGARDVGPEDGGEGDSGEPDAGGDEPWEGYQWEPPEDLCGLDYHQWLPPDQVGHVTSWEEEPSLRLTAELLGQLLAAAGYDGLVDIRFGVRVFRMEYTTQDHGRSVRATGVVALPDPPPADMVELPTILAMHPTVGFADRCAPSRGLEGPGLAMIPASQGYIGVAPDLLGLCGLGEGCEDMPHPYLVGEPTAIAGLDAVRAAHEALADVAEDTGVVPDSRVVPWGPSQGGHGAMMVDRYLGVYAPEFDHPCTAAVVPPSDLAGQARYALASMDGPIELAVAFMTAAYLWYQPDVPLTALYQPDFGERVVDVFPQTCSGGDLIGEASSLEDIFAPSFLQTFREEGWEGMGTLGCIVEENSVPSTSVPRLDDAEVFYLLGERDGTVRLEVEEESVRALCDQGYRIQTSVCQRLGHYDAVVQSVNMQLGWVESCLAGERIPDDLVCVVPDPVQCQ